MSGGRWDILVVWPLLCPPARSPVGLSHQEAMQWRRRWMWGSSNRPLGHQLNPCYQRPRKTPSSTSCLWPRCCFQPRVTQQLQSKNAVQGRLCSQPCSDLFLALTWATAALRRNMSRAHGDTCTPLFNHLRCLKHTYTHIHKILIFPKYCIQIKYSSPLKSN